VALGQKRLETPVAGQWRFNQTSTQKMQVKSQEENTANKCYIRSQATRGWQVHAQCNSQQGKHIHPRTVVKTI